MARIDITSIPNAPGLPANPGVMEPTLQSAEPVMQGMSRLRQESMPLDAFSGEAKGMQAVGAGIGQLATPLNQFADAMSRAKIAADEARLDVAKDKWKSDLAGKLQALPPEQHDQAYRESLPDLEKAINSLDISPAAKNKTNPKMIRFLGETQIAVNSGAKKLQISNMRDSISTAAQGDIDNGNYEGAIERINQAVGTIFSKPEGDKMIQKIKSDQQRQGWQQTINADPAEALKALQEDLPKGDSSTFKGANPVELYRLTETARAEVNRQRSDASRNIENLMDAGVITTDAQIKEADQKGYIDDSTYKALQNRLKNVNPNYEGFAALQTEIAQLVPRDPKDPRYNDFMEKTQELRNRVNSEVGSAYRSPFIQELNGKLQRSVSGTPVKPEDGVLAEAKTHINHLFETNTFGAFGKIRDPKTGVVDEAEKQKYEAAWAKKEQFLDLFSAAVKSGKISDHSSASNWINDNLNDAQKKILGNKLNQPAQGGFLNGVQNFLEDPIGTLKGTPTPPYSIYDEAKARSAGPKPSPTPLPQGAIPAPKPSPTPLPQGAIPAPKPSPTPLPQGAIPAPKGSKVTNYWPTEVKGKDGIVGNHENHLQSGDFAASPDIEESLKANGVKPGDTVLIHLSDGDTIPAKFNDSTAQDDRRKKEGKGPLRGRFDLWTATKGHPKDGVAVVGYSLPNRQS